MLELNAKHPAPAAISIAVDAHEDLRGPYTAAAGLMLALMERPNARKAAAARLPVLLPILPELRERVSAPDVVERSLEFTRAGNWPRWTARTAHGICDFVIACMGRASLTLEFSNWASAGSLDREFADILARRTPHIAISFHDSGARVPDRIEDGPALAETARRYLSLAYYDAAIDAGERSLRALGPDAGPGPVCEAVRAIVFGHMMLGRFETVDTLVEEWLERSADPALLAHICYGKAIMDARLREAAAQDLKAARRWVGQAATHSEAMPHGRDRAVNLSFMKNTLALIEMREGNIAEARRLLDLAIAELARDAPEAFATEGAVLLQNSARLYGKQGKPEKARDALDRLTALEPGNGPARSERARMRAEAGDAAGALAELDAAIAWEPPFADFHLQRGLIRLDAGDVLGAVRDSRRNLELAPDDPRALCLLGLCGLRQGKPSAAERHFSAAISIAPGLADAWANRAGARVKRGRLRAALADLDQALSLRDDPVIARNRAKVAALMEES